MRKGGEGGLDGGGDGGEECGWLGVRRGKGNEGKERREEEVWRGRIWRREKVERGGIKEWGRM